MSLIRYVRQPRVQAPLLTLVVFGLGSVVYLISPTESFLYPRCLLHEGTGLYCPGCGASRAVHAAFHGRWGEAADFNLWVFLVLPVLALFWAVQLYSAVRYNRYWMMKKPLLLWAPLIVVGLAYGILRNLPYPSLAWLAP